jgi:hypothetical protein
VLISKIAKLQSRDAAIKFQLTKTSSLSTQSINAAQRLYQNTNSHKREIEEVNNQKNKINCFN